MMSAMFGINSSPFQGFGVFWLRFFIPLHGMLVSYALSGLRVFWIRFFIPLHGMLVSYALSALRYVVSSFQKMPTVLVSYAFSGQLFAALHHK